jgi:acetoin utilization protein AcuB
MTRSPHTIGHHQTLAAAHLMMREFSVRHLPVLNGGKLVGILSQRDLNFIETLRDVDPEDVAVAEAMTQEIFTVDVRAELRSVAAEMAKRKYGCAIVVEHAHVVGVFTTTDALNALSSLLEARNTQH